MQIDIGVLIGVLSGGIGIVFTIIKMKNSNKEDIRKSTTEQTIVSTKLDYISKGVDDIRLDMKAQDTKINNVIERLIKVEESSKSAHHRLDDLEKKEG